jgi:DHA1 family multidrug resistance protein-like MFS transporter
MPRARSKRILLWMCVLITVNQLGFGGIIPALALYARSFGVTQSAIGVAIAIYGLARFLIAMPAGQLADRVGRRPALTIGGLATAAGNLLCAYAPSFAVLVGARFVAGIGAGLVLITGQIVLADISTPARRGRVMAVYHGVFLFAVGVGPLPGGILAERYGLRAPFLAYAVAGVVAATLAWMWIPETREARRRDGADADSPLPSFGSQVRILTGHTGFMLVSLVSFMNAVARTGGLFNVIPVLAEERLALTTSRIGVGLALASLVGLVLVYPSGVLVDRFGRKSVIVPATLLSGVSLLLFLLAPSYGWFLTACVVWSIATGVSGAAPAAYAADVSPAGMNAAAMSVYRMLADLGYVLGPLALGLATDLVGANLTLAATAVLLVGSGLLFALHAPESHRPDRL